MSHSPVIGVLSLQGDFQKHRAMLTRLGAESVEIREPGALEPLQGLIIPGGESTTLLKFFQHAPWMEHLKRFGASRPVFGTCAGAILLSETVLDPVQPSLGLLPAVIRRNGYGRQVDSHTSDLTDHLLGGGPLPAVFIRAPIFDSVGEGVEVLASQDSRPVLVRYGSVLAATFHPELTEDTRIHQYFLEML